jgi:hypothetical protein
MRDPTVIADHALIEAARRRLESSLEAAHEVDYFRFRHSLERVAGYVFDPRDLMTRNSSFRRVPPLPTPKKKRGRGRRDETLRDDAIVSVIAWLVEHFGLRPTRSHAKRRLDGPSACSIVQAALAQLGLHRDERSVEGIWGRFQKSSRP